MTFAGGKIKDSLFLLGLSVFFPFGLLRLAQLAALDFIVETLDALVRIEVISICPVCGDDHFLAGRDHVQTAVKVALK